MCVKGWEEGGGDRGRGRGGEVGTETSGGEEQDV